MSTACFKGDPLGYCGNQMVAEYDEALLDKIGIQSDAKPSPPSAVASVEGKVGILGAGIGGLYTALILDSLGIEYEILEASNRTGGRLFTYKFPGGGKYDYYDVGAMRYPLPKKDEQGRYKNGIMKRLGDLIEYPKLNEGDVPLKSTLIPYYYEAKEGAGFLYYNRVHARTNDSSPDFDARGMGVKAEYIRVGAKAISKDVVHPFVTKIVKDIEKGGTEGWKEMKAHDAYSVRAYMALKYIPSANLGLPQSALPMNVINWCGVLCGSSGGYERALTEAVFSSLAFAKTKDIDFGDVEWKCFDGGSEVLSKHTENYINGPNREKGVIHFNKRVTAMSTDTLLILGDLVNKGVPREALERMKRVGVSPNDVRDLLEKGVTHSDIDNILRSLGDRVSQGLPNDDDVFLRKLKCMFALLDLPSVVVSVAGESKPRRYSHVISTLPLTCLRTIDMRGTNLTVMQRTALRQLQHGPAIKIGMRFKEPWWTTKLGIVGGQSFTDLPIRTIVYPSYGVNSETPSTVLIASYLWTSDADRLSALLQPGNEKRLEELVLRNLAEVHGGVITYDYLKGQLLGLHAWDWNHDPLSMGAFPFFGPGDFQDLYASLNAPAADGRLHFAVEALSTRHAWVVGALDSAWRAVNEYLFLSRQTSKLKHFTKVWGNNTEWTEAPPTAAAPVATHRSKPKDFPEHKPPREVNVGFVPNVEPRPMRGPSAPPEGVAGSTPDDEPRPMHGHSRVLERFVGPATPYNEPGFEYENSPPSEGIDEDRAESEARPEPEDSVDPGNLLFKHLQCVQAAISTGVLEM